jgi:hypothetical protein
VQLVGGDGFVVGAGLAAVLACVVDHAAEGYGPSWAAYREVRVRLGQPEAATVTPP